MKRKTIAVCISGYHPESESKVISELINNCKKNDVNLLVFNSLMIKGDFPVGIDQNSNLVRGESEIFNLINYQQIDGLILFGNSIFKKETVLEIRKRCQKYKIPLINVNDPSNHFEHNIVVQNTYSMELVVEHLIKVHKFTRINFIGGFPDNKETIERLNAYKKILTKYKIPVEDRRIGYGQFWRPAIDCAKKFLQEEVPQAIVCANDTMAILVADYLKSEGYDVPRDVAVTGFDGISDADVYNPPLTTVRPRYNYAGLQIYQMMMRLLNNEENVEDLCIESELIVQESCGCNHSKKTFFNFTPRYEKDNILAAFNKQMIGVDIYFSDEQTPDDLFNHITAPLDIIKFQNFVFCIDENLSKKEEYFFDTKATRYGIPAKVHAVVPYYTKFSDNKIFPSKDLLWYNFLEESESVVRFFAPLYYKDHCLGYIVYLPQNYATMESAMFQVWAFSAAEKIGSFFLKRELELLNIKDHFTGLYNRRGMEKYFEEVYKKVIPNGEYVSVVCIDIDYLKTINDKYGHEQGDNAILQSSLAIKQTFNKNSICVRTGGDEFCVLTHSPKKQNLDKMIEKLDKILEDYNAKSGLPYEVICSCGHFTLFSKVFSSFEEMQRIADSHLYEVKAKHHRRRNTDDALKSKAKA